MNVEIAERLAARRKQAGLSQEALAERLGVSRQAVSKWERSESSPDTDNLIALAQLYGVSLDELLYVEDSIADDVAFEAEDRAAGRDAGAAGGPDADAAPGAGASKGTARFVPGGFCVEDGEERVTVSWREGVHVVDGAKGEEVHVGWDGVHVRGQGAAAHAFAHEGHDPFDWHEAQGFRQMWLRFPFWLVAILAYLLLGVFLDAWGPGLFVFFLVPVYYVTGVAIAERRLAPAVCALYPLGVTAWFFWMAFVEGAWHPAWAIFLTIPIVECLTVYLSRGWQKRRRAREQADDVIDVEGASGD